MTPKTELPAGFKLAENLEAGDVIDVASNHYVITSKVTNAFKEITLWLEVASFHALYGDIPTSLKATLTLDPKVIIKIHE